MTILVSPGILLYSMGIKNKSFLESVATKTKRTNPCLEFLAILFSSAFFVGYFPVASGTAGSLWGVLAYSIPSGLEQTSLWTQGLCILVLFFLGIWAIPLANQRYQEVDSSRIVIDEVVGMLLTFLGRSISLKTILLGFFLFRFFDVVKIPPARFFDQKIKNAWGVMLDDVVAGVYANLGLYFFEYFLKT